MKVQNKKGREGTNTKGNKQNKRNNNGRCSCKEGRKKIRSNKKEDNRYKGIELIVIAYIR